MTHDDRRLVPFLAGELPAAQAEEFEAHLVACDGCWRAVSQDRRGRALAESLRELAPATLRDRIRMQTETGPAATGPTGTRRRRAVAALAAAALLVGAAAWATTSRHPRETVVAAVVRAAQEPSPPASVVRDGQVVVVTRSAVDGRPVTVAESAGSFPMPDGGRHLGNGPGSPWVAQQGALTVVCLSQPENLLLVSDLPPDRLIAWAQAGRPGAGVAG